MSEVERVKAAIWAAYLADPFGFWKGGAAQAAIAAIDEARGWRPIESAPRDGTWVLLTGGQVDDDFINDEQKGGLAFPPSVVAQFTRFADGQPCAHWQFAWYDGGFYGRYDKPTHWQPLPAPPKGGE